jgi:hypothetical protein
MPLGTSMVVVVELKAAAALTVTLVANSGHALSMALLIARLYSAAVQPFERKL